MHSVFFYAFCDCYKYLWEEAHQNNNLQLERLKLVCKKCQLIFREHIFFILVCYIAQFPFPEFFDNMEVFFIYFKEDNCNLSSFKLKKWCHFLPHCMFRKHPEKGMYFLCTEGNPSMLILRCVWQWW